MDYSKLSEKTLNSLANNEDIDYSQLSEEELNELAKLPSDNNEEDLPSKPVVSNRFLPEYDPTQNLTPEDRQWIAEHPNETMLDLKKDPNLEKVGEKFRESQSNVFTPYNQGMAALSGTMQGASLGTADEIIAGLMAGGRQLTDKDQDLIKDYYQYKERLNTAQNKLAEMYPKTTVASELAGGLFTPIPGANLAKRAVQAGQAAKEAKALSSAVLELPKSEALAMKSKATTSNLAKTLEKEVLGTGIGIGGVAGFGTSEGKLAGEEDDQKKLLLDTLFGAGLGGGVAATGALGHKTLQELTAGEGFKKFKDAYKLARNQGLKVGETESQNILEKDFVEKANAYANKLQEENFAIAKKIAEMENKGQKFGTEDVLKIAEDRLNSLEGRQNLSKVEEEELQALKSMKEQMTSELRNIPTITKEDSTPKLLEKLKQESEIKRSAAEREGREVIGGDVIESTLPSGQKSARYELHEKLPQTPENLSTLTDEDVLKQYTQLSTPELGGADYKKIAGKEIILPDPKTIEGIQSIRIPKESPQITAKESREIEKMLSSTQEGETSSLAKSLKSTRKKGLGKDYEEAINTSAQWLEALEVLGVPKNKIQEIQNNPDLRIKLAEMFTPEEFSKNINPIKSSSIKEQASKIKNISSPELQKLAEDVSKSSQDYETLQRLNKESEGISPSIYASAQVRPGVRLSPGLVPRLGSVLGSSAKTVADLPTQMSEKLSSFVDKHIPKTTQETAKIPTKSLSRIMESIGSKSKELKAADIARMIQVSKASDISSRDISDPAKLSNQISSADDREIYDMTEVLKGTPFDSEAFELQKALLNGDRFKVEAIKNKIIQNPDARKILGEISK